MPVAPFLGGIFNIVDPFFYLQMYIWIWMLLTFFAICAWLAFRFGAWEKYKPLWGLYYAYKASSNAAFIFNATLKAELFSEAQAKCIFDYASYKYEGFSEWRIVAWFERFIFNYSTVFLDDLNPLEALIYKFGKRNMDVEIAKKLQNYKDWEEEASVNVGGSDTDIILDADRWTVKTSPQHKAIVNYCEVWNDGPASGKDEIHTYSKFQKYLNNGTIQVTEALSVIKPKTLVPWVRIDAAFPIDVEDNEQAGARRQQAEDEMNSDANQFNKYIPHILGGGFIFAIVIIAMRFIAFAWAHNG